MIELAKHIEILLLENDCVIVPGLGGFIAHHRPALRKRDGRFCPPLRTVGFNPRIVMNDGLLAQSYMQAYNTDFPDATRKIEQTVERVKEALYQEGEAGFPHIGTLYYNMDGVYEFAPERDRLSTPSLYGLGGFTAQALAARPAAEAPLTSPPARTAAGWWRHTAAVAAAVVLFFLLSVSAENTFVEETQYASLGSAGLFENIRHQSLVASVIPQPGEGAAAAAPQEEHSRKPLRKNNVNTLKPVAVKTEKVTAQAREDQPAGKAAASRQTPAKRPAPTAGGKAYYVIVASLGTRAEAQAEVRRLAKDGFGGATVLEAGDKFRVALARHDSRQAAQRQTDELKKDTRFRSAWVLPSKPDKH